MAEENDPLEQDELENVEGEALPDREVMSVITTGFDEPVPLPTEPLKGGEEL